MTEAFKPTISKPLDIPQQPKIESIQQLIGQLEDTYIEDRLKLLSEFLTNPKYSSSTKIKTQSNVSGIPKEVDMYENPDLKRDELRELANLCGARIVYQYQVGEPLITQYEIKRDQEYYAKNKIIQAKIDSGNILTKLRMKFGWISELDLRLPVNADTPMIWVSAPFIDSIGNSADTEFWYSLINFDVDKDS